MSKITQKREEAARAAKEKKQKKLLIVLAPILLLMIAWQGPGLLKGGGGAATTSAGATTLVSTAPDAPVDPTGAAPTTAGGAPVATPSGTGDATLPDTDETVVAGEGQLVRFDRFLGKDPFQQQVDDTPAAVPSGPPAGGSTGGSGGTVTPVPNEEPTEEPSAYGSATVTVNGVEEQLTKGATFPESDPLFKLVSISANNVKVGLVSGSFSGGKKTVTVKVGKTVTLVSQPDGVRYVIKLTSTNKA